jgi:Ser/Thr protein kinase RdoA (MazF antagonist)
LDKIVAAAEQFTAQGSVKNIQEYGNGNINSTYLVTLDIRKEKRFILQCINRQVFRMPELVMQNMILITEHIQKRLLRAPLSSGRRWVMTRVLKSRNGRDFWIDSGGSFWRAISFIDNAQSFDILQDTDHAAEAGCAVGIFHNLLSELPPERLADTLKGFHNMPSYLHHYREVMAKDAVRKSPEVKYCIKFVEERRAWAHVLEDAREKGRLCPRTIHGDPKVNNILMDTVTGQAVSIIDLDTVRSGLIHYDIGDCIRSGCNPQGEDPEQWEEVSFETDFCRSILQGYQSAAGEFLTDNDYDYLYDAIRLLSFELGLRYFTDYLEGNIYFKSSWPERNLFRALVQFKLTERIETLSESICAIIRDIRRTAVK